MEDGTIGRRYARALALVLQSADGVDDKGALAQVEKELSALADLMRQRGEFRQAMLNPSFLPADRAAILAAIAKANDFHPVTARTLALLVDKDRLGFLTAIADAFRAEVDARTGQVRASITAAKPLDDAEVREVVAALEKRTSKKVLAEVDVDETVISGLKARIGGLVFDGTVRAGLERLRAELNA